MNLQKAFILDAEKFDIDKRITQYQEAINEFSVDYQTERNICLHKINLLQELKLHLKPALEEIKPLIEDSVNDAHTMHRTMHRTMLNFKTGEQYYQTKFNKDGKE